MTNARLWLRTLYGPPPSPNLTMAQHSDSVTCVARYIDGRIISGSADGTVKLWNPETGEVQEIIRHGSDVKSVCVVGVLIASGSEDDTVRLWDPRAAAVNPDYRPREIIRHDFGFSSVCAVR